MALAGVLILTWNDLSPDQFYGTQTLLGRNDIENIIIKETRRQYGFMDVGSQFTISEKLNQGQKLEKFIGFVHCPNRVWGNTKIIRGLDIRKRKLLLSRTEDGKIYTYNITSHY